MGELEGVVVVSFCEMGSRILSRCLCEDIVMLPGISEDLWTHKDAVEK